VDQAAAVAERKVAATGAGGYDVDGGEALRWGLCGAAVEH
jgi:hypothetical protein